MPVIRFTDLVFLHLHDKVMEKYFMLCRKKGHDPTLFRTFEKYGYEDSNNPSLVDVFKEDPKSGEFIKTQKINVNPSYFYKRYREAKKGTAEIGILSDYLKIFLLFLNHKSKETFLDSLQALTEDERISQLRLWGQSFSQPSSKAEVLTFYGGYYSLEKSEVRNFRLEFTVGRDKRDPQTSSFATKRYGTTASFVLGDRMVKYSGFSDKVGIHLYSTLWLEGNSDLNVRGSFLILQLGIADLDEVPILSGIYSAVTRHGHTVSGEVLFFRKENIDQAESERLTLGLERYLFSKAKQTLLKAPPFSDVSNLKYENYLQNAKALKSKVGYYQFVYMRRDGNMIVSRFHLHENYKITFKTPFSSRYLGFFRVSTSGHNFYLTFVRPEVLKTDFFSTINLTVEMNFGIEGEVVYPGSILYVERNGQQTRSKCLVRKVQDTFEPINIPVNAISKQNELFQAFYNELNA